MSFTEQRNLPTVEEVTALLPLDESGIATKRSLEKELSDIMSGVSRKKLILVGPCAVDYEESIMDYMFCLSELQKQVSGQLLLVPRLYTAKPRTSFSGYTGILCYQLPADQIDYCRGIIASRRIHARVLQEAHLISADELLFPFLFDYYKDVVSYFAIGARNTENQLYAWFASGCDCPVGFKNPRNGQLSVMLNAIAAARSRQVIPLIGKQVITNGNEFSHAILRGYTNHEGYRRPNYGISALQEMERLKKEHDCLQVLPVIIDCSHDNSGKDYAAQIDVCRNVLMQTKASPQTNHAIRGFMIESYLMPGKQAATSKEYGKSLVDGCLGWDQTKNLILEIAESFQ